MNMWVYKVKNMKASNAEIYLAVLERLCTHGLFEWVLCFWSKTTPSNGFESNNIIYPNLLKSIHTIGPIGP